LIVDQESSCRHEYFAFESAQKMMLSSA